MNTEAITKLYAIILAAIIVIAALASAIVFMLFVSQNQMSEDIKIGLCADLDMSGGKAMWQAAVLAAEQVNAQGGILGRQVEIIAQDDDSSSGNDLAFATNAFNKLVTADKVDFVVAQAGFVTVYMDLAAQHKKILIASMGGSDELAQRVIDDYDSYKYFFRTGGNNSITAYSSTLSVLDLSSYTGFTKIAVVYLDQYGAAGWIEPIIGSLRDDYGLDIVYTDKIPATTVDFTSYFAKAEAAGAEILYAVFFGSAASFVKEYYDRQSPMVLWGIIGDVGDADAWEVTEGKCECVSTVVYPVVADYPLTSKTIQTGETYFERWNEEITTGAAAAYDIVRFILPDAIKRAGTTETEAVIKALETINVETSSDRSFRFTSSHDVMIATRDEDDPNYVIRVCMFQWQEDGRLVPVWPRLLMEESGAIYTYPEWDGPWNKP